MIVNFIGLELDNQYWSTIKRTITESRLFDYINYQKIKDNTGSTSICDEDPHITLAYSNEFTKGPNWFNWFLTIKNRDLYNQLRDYDDIRVSTPIVDIFDNPDSKVLKLNMSGCDCIEILRSYSEQLYNLTPNGSDWSNYNPHITLTYLKPETPLEYIEDFKNKLILSNYKSFQIKGFMMSEKDNPSPVRIKIQPKE